MLRKILFKTMLLLVVALVLVNCVQLSERQGNDSSSDILEQISFPSIKYSKMFLRRLWETKNSYTAQDIPVKWTDIEFTNRTKFNPGILEQNLEDFENSNLYHGLLMKKIQAMEGRRKRFAKQKMSFIDDITYGRFGHCYNIPLFSDEPFIMIDRCPKWSKSIEDIELCSKSVSLDQFKTCTIDMELVPVTDSRGYIYKNLYCARCNNVIDVRTWEVELIYEYNSPSPFHLMDSDETMTLLGNIENAGTCTPYVYTLKPKSKFLCKNFQDFSKISRFHRSRYNMNLNKVDENSNSAVPLSFQIFINFGISGKGHVMFSTFTKSPIVEHRCDQHEIYDPELNQCRPVTCGEGYILVDYSCRLETQKYDKLSEKHLYDVTKKSYTTNTIFRLNVTLPDIIILQAPGVCSSIVREFAERWNISTDRIANFKINLLNDTSSGAYAEEHAIANETENWNSEESNEDCNTHLVNYTLPANISMVTTELSFTLLPDKTKVSYSKYMDMLNFRKTFSFDINGTEFKAINPVANNPPIKLDIWCVKGKKATNKNFKMMVDVDKKTGKNVTGVYINSTGKFYPPGMYDLFFMVSGQIGNISHADYAGQVFVCDLPKIALDDCVRFQISNSNYIRLRNSSILLNKKTVLDMDQYEYVDDSDNSTDIQVCVPPDYLRDPKFNPIKVGCGDSYSNVMKAEGYLSFVLGIFSIVVLTAVIITYSIFSQLRNLPGLNMLSLTLSLVFGELLFITSGYVQQTGAEHCAFIGVFLHFIFLASFFWMNVMSYDVYCTFTKTKSILTRIRRTKRYFPLYSLYAWGSPAVIVGVCCIIDFSHLIPNFIIGYGGSSGDFYEYEFDQILENGTNTPTIMKLYRQKFGCWIQEPVAALVAFGLPMILILFANAVMFIRTIICIRSVKKHVSKRIRHSSLKNAIGQHDVVLYIRMSTVMGFTWIFGLASSIVSSFSDKPSSTVCVTLHVLGMFFIVLNCSQGLFIFFVFVFNRRVGSLYKNLFRRCRCNICRNALSSTSSSVASVSENTHI